MSCSSLFPRTFDVEACSAFSTLPRSGRMACVRRSRPCLAEPPALSPSTMNSSLSAGSVDEQSASLPGRFSRWLMGVLRSTCCVASRRASRARAARIARATIASPALPFSSSHCSSAGRTTPSTAGAASGLFRRSFVWPWNCGSGRYTETTATTPSRMSSAVKVTPLGWIFLASMKARTALTTAVLKPFSCVPPEPVGTPLAYERT